MEEIRDSDSTISDLDIVSLSDADIARMCDDAAQSGSWEKNRRVVRLLRSYAVKIGEDVTPEEVANQEFARSCVTGFRIPKIYRYFRRSNKGYLVMEYLEGSRLDEIQYEKHPNIIRRLTEALHSLAVNPLSDYPGPTNGGEPRGYLFSDAGAGETFKSISYLNSWFNRRARLRSNEPGFNFKLSECRFCHLDLARRNMILLPDSSLGLLDWGSAGFYPRVFETYCLRYIQQHDYNFTRDLLRSVEDRFSQETDPEEVEYQIRLLDRVFQNNLQFNFKSSTQQPDIELQLQQYNARLKRDITPATNTVEV